MHVNEEACQFPAGGNAATVVFDSDQEDGSFPSAIEKLNSPATRQEAICVAAARGIVNPGTSALCTAYPVDNDGFPIGAKAGSFVVDHYQIAVPIQRGR